MQLVQGARFPFGVTNLLFEQRRGISEAHPITDSSCWLSERQLRAGSGIGQDCLRGYPGSGNTRSDLGHAEFLCEPGEKPVALCQLACGDKLVRLVRLVDGAWPADHRRHAGSLKMSRFGSVGHYASTV